MTISLQQSFIYTGNVMHRRFTPKSHGFVYPLYMLALDVDEMDSVHEKHSLHRIFGLSVITFHQKDYLRNEPNSLKQRIKDKVAQLNGSSNIERITMLAQVRCLGIYFSPVNFYFCYDNQDRCTQMLAEVSNTPWNERHYYLIDLTKDDAHLTVKKNFQVSPFMELAMTYHWRINPPNQQSKSVQVKIENWQAVLNQGTSTKVFEASIKMTKQALNKQTMHEVFKKWPAMTLSVVAKIYWQALKIWLKGVPFLGYQKQNN